MHNLSIGLDLGGTKIEVIVLSSQGETILRQRVPTPQRDNASSAIQQYHDIILAITALIQSCEDQLKHEFTNIGMGIPGAINPATNLVKNANTT